MSNTRKLKDNLIKGDADDDRCSYSREHSKRRIVEDMPMKESMGPRKGSWGGTYAYLDNKILLKIAKSYDGKKFNDFYSYLCSLSHKDSIHRREADQWVKYFVERKTKTENGKVYYLSDYMSKWYELSNKDVYIDSDGFLRIYKKTTDKLKYKFQPTFPLHKNENGYFCKVDDIWYRFHMKEVEFKHSEQKYTGMIVAESVVDVHLRPNKYYVVPLSKAELVKTYGIPMVCVLRQQAGKKELKKLRGI